MTFLRHQWSAPEREQYRTLRTCIHCGLVRITRHDGPRCWTEWAYGDDTFPSRLTPPCTRIVVAA